MKFTIAKRTINVENALIGITFFSVIGFVLRIHSIDLSILLFGFILFVYARFLRKIENLPSYLDLAILAALAVLIPLLTKMVFSGSIYSFFFGYAISAIGFVILITVLFENLELSLLFAMVISFMGASVDGGDFSIAVTLLSSSLAGALFSYRVRRRFQLIRAVSLASAVHFIVSFIVEHKDTSFAVTELDWDLFVICFINGLVSLAIILIFQPIFEYVFRIVTNISLLELSDFNHPLLRRLILEAPGTYQHSLVVANLSESAAEAIGANALLARVGAYYHDIGKLLKPEYFVENLVSYRDIHKNLKPSMSKLIIFNHVKEGVELAKKSRLNPKIIDFILQHHGKTLVYYFYQRAKALEPEANHEEEYRYPGPKPQTKEIAIVSLADTIEALSRTLDEPTPARIEDMVRDVVRKRFMEGELDECSLTLRDLEKITQSFIRILNAIFHTRVNYPKDEDRNNKPPKVKEDQS